MNNEQSQEYTNPFCMRRLMHSVQALAQPAEVQLSLFPDFVCKADELALDFDQSWTCAKANDGAQLTTEQVLILDSISNDLDLMSGSANTELWADAALYSDTRWGHIREIAQAALVALNWPNEIPPNENTYVPSRIDSAR